MPKKVVVGRRIYHSPLLTVWLCSRRRLARHAALALQSKKQRDTAELSQLMLHCRLMPTAGLAPRLRRRLLDALATQSMRRPAYIASMLEMLVSWLVPL